jgi:hypothetical protein
MVHELKTWPQFFGVVKSGDKKMELRKNDRLFKVGDDLILKEWDPVEGKCTGRICRRRITHIYEGTGWGLLPGFAILSIKKLPDLKLPDLNHD